MAPRRKGTRPADEPTIVDMGAQRVVVVETVGDPALVGASAMAALFGTVYGLKFERKRQGRDFKVGAVRARWPDAHLVPRDQWHALWALPVPEDVESVPPGKATVPVRLETWRYGESAQIVHHGSYADEAPTIARLREFIAGRGYEIAGTHEEEYLTRPEVKDPRTVIRYPVRPSAT